MLNSISRGENLYIMPYKHLADYELDTFMSYELSVYRPYLLNTVRQLSAESSAPESVANLLHFMENLIPIDTEWVPEQSLIREFIGGSLFTG